MRDNLVVGILLAGLTAGAAIAQPPLPWVAGPEFPDARLRIQALGGPNAGIPIRMDKPPEGLRVGQVALRCKLTRLNIARDCTVLSEYPAGMGLGAMVADRAGLLWLRAPGYALTAPDRDHDIMFDLRPTPVGLQASVTSAFPANNFVTLVTAAPADENAGFRHLNTYRDGFLKNDELRVIDLNADGALSLEEFRAGFRTTSAQVTEAWRDFDQDHDGTLKLGEIENTWRPYTIEDVTPR